MILWLCWHFLHHSCRDFCSFYSVCSTLHLCFTRVLFVSCLSSFVQFVKKFFNMKNYIMSLICAIKRLLLMVGMLICIILFRKERKVFLVLVSLVQLIKIIHDICKVRDSTSSHHKKKNFILCKRLPLKIAYIILSDAIRVTPYKIINIYIILFFVLTPQTS